MSDNSDSTTRSLSSVSCILAVQLHTLGQSLSQNIAVSGRDALLSAAYHMLVVARGLIVLLLLMLCSVYHNCVITLSLDSIMAM